MAEAVVPNGVYDSVRQPVEAIHVDQKKQRLAISIGNRILDAINTQYTVDFLRRHPNAVDKISIMQFSRMVPEAVEILRTFLSETTIVQEILLTGHLGENNGRRLLTGLYGNTSVTILRLHKAGFGGAAGGRILSDLLLNNSYLQRLFCKALPLSPEGARALQPSLISNEMKLDYLDLEDCRLGDEGFGVIVNALLDGNNKSVRRLDLLRNGITSNGLPHLSRLLELYSSLDCINLSSNPSIFRHESAENLAENTRLFLRALSRTKLRVFGMSGCQIPGPVMSLLLHSIANNKWLAVLHVYDRVRIQGKDFEDQLKIIPKIRYLTRLRINLDSMDASVLASFHRNISIRHLHTGLSTVMEITTGRMFDILDRNRRLYQAGKLIRRDCRGMVPSGLWSKGIEKLTCESTGATAAYKILRSKLVMWWIPSTTSSTTETGSTTTASVAASASAAASAPVAPIENKKRSLPQDSAAGDDDDVKPNSQSMKRMRQSSD